MAPTVAPTRSLIVVAAVGLALAAVTIVRADDTASDGEDHSVVAPPARPTPAPADVDRPVQHDDDSDGGSRATASRPSDLEVEDERDDDDPAPSARALDRDGEDLDGADGSDDADGY